LIQLCRLICILTDPLLTHPLTWSLRRR